MPLAAALPGNSQFHIGIDFIKTRIVADPGFLFDFTPYSVVGPNTNFVTQGGVGTLTEHQVQRQIIMAVEDSFRQINTGNAQTTVAIAIHDGVVNTNLPGRRLNVAMAGSIQELGLLGQAKQAAYTGSFPQDGYAAVTYLDRIDQMGDDGHIVVYDTLPEIVYAVAGTTAHEIGHVFDAVHVNTTANVSPQPLMASSGTGLPAAARFVKREFSITQPAGTSNALTILNNAGTVVRGDSNMDQIVDGLDLSIVFSNWALDDRLFHEGDANNDHLVDGLDVAQVFSNWTSDSSSTTSFTQSISGTFNPQTGEVTVSSDGVANWFLQSDTGGLAFENAFETLSGFEGVALSQNANRVGMASIGSAPLSSLAFDSLSLGPIAAIGSLDLQLLYNASQGSPLQSARLTIVPEPGCMGVAAVIYLCSQRRNFRYSPR
ncbi:MAG: hypothetical protein O3C60_20460 [Planctomycetota bacterium]|nr:hypothetical protein [Planctomycetota bacterium]